jgi:hypothetical protein
MKKLSIGIAILSLIFLCGLCDRTSSLEYVIENSTDTKLEIKLFGLSGYLDFVKKDSTRILEMGDHFTIMYEEQMGRVSRSRIDSIYFLDSITCKRLDNDLVANIKFKKLESWDFSMIEDYYGEYRLKITDEDF